MPPIEFQSVAQLRETGGGLPQWSGRVPPVAHVEDRIIGQASQPVRVRVYYGRAAAPYPVLLYFHGGGWTFCGIESHDPVCRTLAAIARCAVVSVDYRLAPENRFPAALDDCFAALHWARSNAGEMDFDAARMSLGGDSAGGNLAAAIALKARDRGLPLVHQLLVYPVLDYYQPGTPSYAANGEGYLLTRAAMARFWDGYLRHKRDASNPLACPLRCRDLSGLPRALIMTAEFDPLRDEGANYARRLRRAGVPARLICYSGAIHGFWNMGGIFPQGIQALVEAGEALRKIFWDARARRMEYV